MSQARPLVMAWIVGVVAALAPVAAFAGQAVPPPAAVTPAPARQGPATNAPARQALADLPGVRLWFTDSGGAGEPVVLMHANTGTSDSWEPQIAALSSAGYRVIAFDRRGWDRSIADPGTGPQPGHASEDLHALANHLALDRFHLVGVAGGGSSRSTTPRGTATG